MSDTEAGAAWSFNDVHDELNQNENTKNEAPLQYVALYAKSQPSNGKVTLNKLGAILARTNISNDNAAIILEHAAEPSTQLVSEQDFYWALAQVSALQANPGHSVVYEGPDSLFDLPLKDIELPERDNSDDNDINNEEIGVEWDVPAYDPTAEHTLYVTLMTKNAGSFFMKHAVYSIEGHFKEKPVKVLRRFRDFASLSVYLIKRYPFRMLPMLPPKRLSMNGKYLVGDSQDAFLNRRAASSSRFLNLLLQHPTLANDSVIEMFLFSDTHFNPHNAPTDEELKGKMASPLFISQWKQDKLEEWKAIEVATHEYVAQITSLCLIAERHTKRLESENADNEAMGRNFIALSRFLHPLYPYHQEDLGGIQQRLEEVAKYTDSRHEQIIDEIERLNDSPLFHLKLYRDMLCGLSDLFARIKSYGGNTIPQQQEQIASAQRKLLAISTKEDVKEEDLHKLRMKIQQAQSSIREQTNRDWLIKMVINQELQMVQQTQYQISKILRNMASFLATSTNKIAELTSQMADTVSTSPLNI